MSLLPSVASVKVRPVFLETDLQFGEIVHAKLLGLATRNATPGHHAPPIIPLGRLL